MEYWPLDYHEKKKQESSVNLRPPIEEESKPHLEEPLILFSENMLSADATDSLMPYLLSSKVLPDTSASNDSRSARPASALSWTLFSVCF